MSQNKKKVKVQQEQVLNVDYGLSLLLLSEFEFVAVYTVAIAGFDAFSAYVSL
jgi:accessory gene regulator protein AgrB